MYLFYESLLGIQLKYEIYRSGTALYEYVTGDILPATLISIFVGAMFYGIIVIKERIITADEIRLIPMIEKITKGFKIIGQ